MSEWASAWPRLDRAVDGDTIETLHLLLQLVGKLPLRLHPWINHGWHVALRLSPRGFITRGLPAGERYFTVELDIHDASLRLECDDGSRTDLPVAAKPVAEVHRELSQLLVRLGLPAPLHGAPNEISDPVPFAEDHRPRAWDGDAAKRLHGAFMCADRGFNRFRALYRGKSSPSHLFWGSFDLAVTRFSGRGAPLHPGGVPGLPDAVTREAYSHEVISAGFWLGGGGFEEAAFYAYAYPTPVALSVRPVEPEEAFWHRDLREFVLPYATVREASDPETALQRFLQSTFEAAADLLDWPPGVTVDGPARFGQPPA